ncbi:MAG TPA: phasin family protein [Alphaproteobacteria bacterium]|nr:phasin family protein [Alphaproteobacteria bacterium]
MNVKKKPVNFAAQAAEQVEAAVNAGAEMFKGYEDVAGFGKENINAVMATGALLSKGIQDMNKAWFALAQDAMEQNVAATKRILGSKSVVEVVEIQSDLARAGYDKAMIESRRLSDMSIKLAEEASAPIVGRVNTAMEAFTKPFAA